MYISIEQLKNNPNIFRDFNVNPINDDKVKTLVKSIKKSSLWDNMVACIKKDAKLPDTFKGKTIKEVVAHIETLPMKEQLAITATLPIILGNGHHRVWAAAAAGVKYTNIKCIPVTDELLLYLQAEENSMDYGGNKLTAIESVRQVYDLARTQLMASPTWEDYKDNGYSVITTSKQFSQCQSQGIGHRPIAKFLGWPESKVRDIFSAMEVYNDGLLDGEEVEKFVSLRQLANFAKLMDTIMAEIDKYHEGFLAALAEDCKQVIIKNGTSSKTISAATAAFKKEEAEDPVEYLKSMRPIPLMKRYRKWIKSCIQDGVQLEGDPTFMELVDEIKGEIEKAAEREAKQAAAEAEREAKVKELMEEGKTREEAVESLGETNLFGEDDEGGDTDEPNVVSSATLITPNQMLTSARITLGPVAQQLEGLLDLAAEDKFEQDDLDTFNVAAGHAFDVFTKLMIRIHGLKKVREMVTAASK